MRASSHPRAAAGGEAWTRRRAAIVRIAASLFDSKGYASTSVSDIARAADLEKASLYHYCESKADLLVQIHSDFMDLLFDKLRRAQSREATAEQKLREVIADILSLMVTHHAYVRSLFEHYRETPPPDRRRITALRRDYEAAVVALVEDGVADGSLQTDDPYLAAMTIFGAANWAYQWFPRSDRDVTTVTDHIAESIFGGLRRRQP